MTDIFREIDEDLRRDRLESIWKRHGAMITGVALAIIAATGGYVAWDNWQASRKGEETLQLAMALTPAPGDAAKADAEKTTADALAGFAGGASTGPATLARFYEAGMRARAGDGAAAVAIYDGLAGSQTVEPVYRELATLLSVMHQLGKGDAVALQARLAPLTGDTAPWRHSAREMMALLAVQAGDTARAKTLLQQLADDAAAPADIRSRAADLAAQYNKS